MHLLQIWIIPDVKEAEPNYQQISLDPRNQPNEWHLIAGPDANAPMHIRQDAQVKSAVLEKVVNCQLRLQNELITFM